jgi:hypothetical protein
MLETIASLLALLIILIIYTIIVVYVNWKMNIANSIFNENNKIKIEEKEIKYKKTKWFIMFLFNPPYLLSQIVSYGISIFNNDRNIFDGTLLEKITIDSEIKKLENLKDTIGEEDFNRIISKFKNENNI